jgi:SNF2 family DNA or RNA helicase
MRIVGNTALFYVEDPEPLMEAMPWAKCTNFKGQWVIAMPHDFAHMQAARGCGLDAPAPIEQYNFPGKFTPFAHQRETMRFLVENMRAYCLNGLGTGKTLATAWGADYLMSQKVIRRCLIVAPLSCLERVWGDSLYQNFPKRKFVVLHGTKQQRLDSIKTDWDFAIVNHHGLGIVGPSLPEDVDLIIFDELAVLRNKQAKTLWGEAKKIMTPQRWGWGLTGSPTPNSPTDSYAQCQLLTPENYKGSFTRFKNDVMTQINQFKWIARAGAEETVNQVMQPSIRYALEDCIDLPETILHSRDAEMSPEQKLHYDKLKKECVTEIQGVQVTAINAAVLCGKLIQASCGILYSNGETLELDFGPRLAVLEECMEEVTGKIIIFAPLTGVIHSLYNKLKKNYDCVIVEGSTSAGKRNQIFNDFNTKDTPQVIIAAPQCMSHGLNLHHKCSTIIWFTAIASNEVFTQANARTVRPGQTQHTNIFMLAASPVERKIYQTLKDRGSFQDIVLSLAKEK